MFVLAITQFTAAGPPVRATAYAEQEPSVEPALIDVQLTEYAFDPAELQALSGTSQLQITNAGLRRHNLVMLIDGKEIESPEVRPGDTVVWEAPVLRPGRYLFWCGEYRHLEKGMIGTFVVRDSAD